MSPKEKALDIVKQMFYKISEASGNKRLKDLSIKKNRQEFEAIESLSKQCALIAVDEIIHEVYDDLEWWKEVKQEIEKL